MRWHKRPHSQQVSLCCLFLTTSPQVLHPSNLLKNTRKNNTKLCLSTKVSKIESGDKNSTCPLVISACNYKWNIERMSNSSQSTCPVGQVLLEKLLQEVILHNTPLCSLLHLLLKDKCMCLQDEWKLLVTCPAGQLEYWNIFVPWEYWQTVQILFRWDSMQPYD